MSRDSHPQTPASGDAALRRLLSYRTPLDGADFSRKVAARTAGRRRRRSVVLGAAAALATATTLALRPRQFDAPPILADVLHESTRLATSLPLGSLAAALIVVTLCLGASKAMDSI
ncbi:hypothetical protein [Stenotrophomonas sp.]|uniref:hypothetical protein n=1 Tax=Stenotrophomonas sp. TaxID=69392 RepID=UPI002FC6F62B